MAVVPSDGKLQVALHAAAEQKATNHCPCRSDNRDLELWTKERSIISSGANGRSVIQYLTLMNDIFWHDRRLAFPGQGWQGPLQAPSDKHSNGYPNASGTCLAQSRNRFGGARILIHKDLPHRRCTYGQADRLLTLGIRRSCWQRCSRLEGRRHGDRWGAGLVSRAA
jgi:hypothetical protein